MNIFAEVRESGVFVEELIQLARRVEERVEAALAGVELSTARFGVLDQLARADEPLALSDLAARLSCVRSNMTQLMDRLEADGLVRRVADPHDRRCIRAELTGRGRELQAVGAAEIRRIHTDVEESLSARDRDAARRVFSKVEGAMRTPALAQEMTPEAR